MTFTPVTSDIATSCWRCCAIGLPPDGIAAGETHLIITDGDPTPEGAVCELKGYCCFDCFNRLRDEIEAGEGEEWKA